MKALVLEKYNEFRYKDVPEPVPNPGDVVIRVHACGICGSDVQGMDGSTGRRIPPLIMGHEGSGIIVEKGKGVEGYEVGDRVTFDSTIYCGNCTYCRGSKINLCDNRRVLGVSCDEYHQDGAFAEYIAVPSRILYPLPETVSYEEAAMVEPLSIAFHAAGRIPFTKNATAVVVGAGMIGLLLIQILRASGCAKIIAVDILQERRDLARKIGADVCLNPERADSQESINSITKGYGADIAFDAVGISASFFTAINCLRKGGALTLIGNLTLKIGLPLQTVVTREITLSGSCASSGEYPGCLDMIARKKINLHRLITAIVPLSEGTVWFGRLYKREPGLLKVILKP